MNSFETTNIISELNNITNSSSDEHEELLAEMELIERLPTQERLKQAKRRRALQLKKWSDYEKEFQTNNTLNSNPDEIIDLNLNNRSSKRKKQRVNFKSRSIKFQDHIVLLDAIMRKDYDEVERLLNSGLTPNSANEDGLTAIHQCCIDDSADLLRLLISYGANVNVCDNDLWTPLHAAATCANLEICKILIENQAELLAVNTDGNMPYDICDDEICLEYIESEMAKKGVTQQAIDMKRSETEMRMLDDLKQICLSKNSFDTSYLSNNHDKSALQNFTTYFSNSTQRDGSLDLNAKDYNGATLLHIACANGYTSILEFLLIDCSLTIESGAKIIAPSLSVTDNDGWSPLHVATFWGHQKAIEILLEYGADINLRTNNDETVLDLCDDPDIRDYIIQKSKEIESQQQQQAALAAMQKQMQLIYNTNSISNSTNSINESIKKSNADNSSIVNNSTRSLKRTSTGVSRSSSVRRSSFRDKEKAARKFDTSFKDVLFANETDENIANIILPKKDEIREENRNVKNSKNLTTVVRIVNNTQTNTNTNNTNSKYNLNDPSKKPYIDDHNNNQLKITQNNMNHQNVARIHSNGQTNNKNTNASISSNSISFASSNNKTKDTTLDNSGNNSSVAVINVNSLEMNSTNKSINSSILKKTYLNETEDQSSIYFNTNRTTTTMTTTNPIETISKTTTIQPVSNQYNQRSNTNNTNNKEPVTSDVDGVKYKFKSNETIGAKNTTNNEFCDVNSDSTSSKFTKCSKCLKRCFVM